MARDFGIRGALLPASRDPDRDVERLERMRAALETGTAHPALMLDFGERFSPKDSARRVRELERSFDLTFVQDPARRRDAAGSKRVSNAIRAAVCGGGRLSSPEEYLAHFHAHALDVVMLGVGSGGVTGALQVADTAYGFELPVVLADSPGNLHAHLASAMPYCMSMEVVRSVRGERLCWKATCASRTAGRLRAIGPGTGSRSIRRLSRWPGRPVSAHSGGHDEDHRLPCRAVPHAHGPRGRRRQPARRRRPHARLDPVSRDGCESHGHRARLRRRRGARCSSRRSRARIRARRSVSGCVSTTGCTRAATRARRTRP